MSDDQEDIFDWTTGIEDTSTVSESQPVNENVQPAQEVQQPQEDWKTLYQQTSEELKSQQTVLNKLREAFVPSQPSEQDTERQRIELANQAIKELGYLTKEDVSQLLERNKASEYVSSLGFRDYGGVDSLQMAVNYYSGRIADAQMKGVLKEDCELINKYYSEGRLNECLKKASSVFGSPARKRSQSFGVDLNGRQMSSSNQQSEEELLRKIASGVSLDQILKEL